MLGLRAIRMTRSCLVVLVYLARDLVVLLMTPPGLEELEGSSVC